MGVGGRARERAGIVERADMVFEMSRAFILLNKKFTLSSSHLEACRDIKGHVHEYLLAP